VKEVIMRTSLLTATAVLALAAPSLADSPRTASQNQSSIVREDAMLEALQSAQPNAALTDKLKLYGQFVGSWNVDIDFYPSDAPVQHAKAEWHFSWVLQGRAVQDVFIFPSRAARAGKPDQPWYFYGSTFRWYDPTLDAWHINYFEPTRPFQLMQIGRAEGSDIVQIGDEVNGVIRRWRFVEITPNAFRWIGETSSNKGGSWTVEMEMRARRAA
jgi:hypothetical protein